MIAFSSSFTPASPANFQPSRKDANHISPAFQNDKAAVHQVMPITLTSGHRTLDRELPGNQWPASTLIELLLANPDSGELRLLASTLSSLTQAGKTLVLLAPADIPLTETLTALGIDLKQVLLLQTDTPADRIWAVEQALQSPNFGALLCWLPHARSEHLRRLHMAATNSKGLFFIFRPLDASQQPSPAPLRMICRPLPANRLSLEIIKRRGPVYLAPMVLPLSVSTPLLSLAAPYAKVTTRHPSAQAANTARYHPSLAA